MKPEAAQHLDKARQALEEARAIAGIELAEAAGRAIYLAASHAKLSGEPGPVARQRSCPTKEDPRGRVLAQNSATDSLDVLAGFPATGLVRAKSGRISFAARS